MNELYKKLVNKEEKMALIGLGYVGLPIAVAFAKSLDVIGYDIDQQRIEDYHQGIDTTNEVGNQAIQKTTVDFTADSNRLGEAKFHIVAVPTPITESNIPNLTPLKEATWTVGLHLTRGSVVVFESTVYPGVTEEVCVPLLEEASGLTCGKILRLDFLRNVLILATKSIV